MYHSWLGARLVRDDWQWTTTKKTVPKEPDKTGYPPWIDNKNDQKMKCLNLDRWEHDVPVIYGEDCNVNQRFICEKGKF